MEKEKTEVLEKPVLPLLIEGLRHHGQQEIPGEAYARINDAVILGS